MCPVRELRVAVTAENYEEALAFYRDALGLPVVESWENEGGSGAILGVGRATLEVLSPSQVTYVDKVEAGGTPSGRCASRSRWKTPRRPPRCSRPRVRNGSVARW